MTKLLGQLRAALADRHVIERSVGAGALQLLIAVAIAGACRAQAPGALTTVQHPLDELPIVARVDLPSSADWITFGFGSIWVVNYRPDRVSRIDSATNTVRADIPIGRNGCLGILADAHRIVVASCITGTMNEIDPRVDSVVRRVPVPITRGREGSFALTDDAYWIPDNVHDSASSTVVRVDRASGAVVARMATGARSDVIVTGFGAIWVASSGTNTVTRIDPTTNSVVATIPVGESPKFMTAGEGAVWVQNRKDGSVSRIDPSTNREVARIAAGAPTPAGDIATGGGAVWLAVDGKSVTRIDPRTNAVTHQFVGGSGADAIRWGYGAAWVADHRVGQLWRVDTNTLPKP